MRKAIASVLAAALAAVFSACGTKDQSPQIVCDVNGRLVETGFTFDGFRDTLVAEHGAADAKANESLKTGSVEVYFKPVAGGRLQAVRVRLVRTRQEVVPAVLFGLVKGGAPVRAAQAVPPAVVAPAPQPANAAPARQP